jgi:PAS domain S-box-containing protein
MQNLMRSTDIATIFLDRSLNIKRYTPRTTDIFNIIPGDIGRPLGHVTHRLFPDNFQKDAVSVLENLQPIEHEVSTADGRTFIARTSPYRTAEDKIDGVVMTFIDITEIKSTGQALLQSQGKYRTLFNSIDEGFCIIEMLFDKNAKPGDYRFLETNEAFEKQTGLLYAVGKTIKEMVPEYEPHWFDVLGKVAKTGEPARFEKEAKALGHYYEVYAFPAGERDENQVAILFKDITERKKVEERQAFLLKLSDALRPLQDPLAIQQTAMQVLGQHMGVNCAYYTEVLPDGDTLLTPTGYFKEAFSLTGTIKISDFDPALHKRYMAGENVVINDVLTDLKLSETGKAAFESIRFRAGIGIPLVKEGKLLAIVTVHQSIPRKWTNDEITLLERVAERTWAAVERAQAEEAVQASEKKYRELVTSLPVAVYTCNAEGRIVFFNEVAVKLWGYVPDLEDKSLRFCACSKVWMMDGTFVPPEQTPMAMALKTGQSFRNIEAIVQRQNGEKFYASVNVDPLFDERGKIKGAINIFQDITIIKEAEIALREGEKQLAIELADMQQLQYISSQLIRENNIDALYGQILEAAIALLQSDAGSLQMHYPERNKLFMLTSRGFHPDSAKFWEWVQVDSKSTCGVALKTNKRIIVPDIEKSKWMTGSEDQKFCRLSGIRAVQSTPLIARNGRLVGMISTHWHKVHQPSKRSLHLLDVLARQAADLIERYQSEEALRRSEENYRVIVNQTITGILKTDLEGRIIFTNEQFEKMLGYSNEELLQMNIADIVYEKDRARHARMFRSLEKEGQGYVIEKRLVRKNGSYIWVNSYNSPISAGDGSLQSVAIISVDISAQKAMEKQKDEFISVASHELRTPLTSIKAYGELLQEIFTEDEETYRTELMKKMNAQVNRLAKLVHGLLDTSRISAGQFALQRETFDLNLLLEERAAEAQLTAPYHKLIVKQGDIAPLHADRERVGQVVTNLISNAVKYSPGANRVIISSKSINDEVKVSVRDFGIGIKPEAQQKIFRRFYRIDASNDVAGLGLGLYISREIIKMHGGTMGVESPSVGEADEPGKGSIFYFKLPYEPTKELET